MAGSGSTWMLAGTGLLLGVLFGAVAQRTHFCTMGAVSDVVLFGSRRRLRVWALAIATALVGTQAFALSGLAPLAAAGNPSSRVFWLGAVLGGSMFGFGMVLAGGCLSRSLVRLGGGSLKALLVVLVAGLAAFLVTTGPLAFLTAGLAAVGSVGLPAPTGGLDAALGSALGLSPLAAGFAATLLVLLPLAAFLADRRFLAGREDVAAGVAIGGLAAIGWLATAALGDPAAAASLTFVEPAGRSLLWLMTGAGVVPGFGVALVGGTVLGAALAALASGGARLETFASRDDMVRHLAGAMLMGAGGAFASGCTVGQGVAGVAALSLQAFLALAAIILGAARALRYLETGRLLPHPTARGAAAGLPSSAAR